MCFCYNFAADKAVRDCYKVEETMKKKIIFVVIPLLLPIMSCGNGETKPQKSYFENWNECSSLTSLKEYVAKVTNKNDKENFIPVEERERGW